MYDLLELPHEELYVQCMVHACYAPIRSLTFLCERSILFQCGLIARGETTWEHLRRERINAAAKLPPDMRPYDRGPLRTCAGFWLGWPSPPAATVTSTVTPAAPASKPLIASDRPLGVFGL